MQNVQKKKGSRKAGRNRIKCESYKARGKWGKNRLRRLKRHLKQQPNDACAKRAFGIAKTARGQSPAA